MLMKIKTVAMNIYIRNDFVSKNKNRINDSWKLMAIEI